MRLGGSRFAFGRDAPLRKAAVVDSASASLPCRGEQQRLRPFDLHLRGNKAGSKQVREVRGLHLHMLAERARMRRGRRGELQRGGACASLHVARAM